MEVVLRDHSSMRGALSRIPLANGLVWGLVGGLVATLVMDLLLMGVLVVAGISALSCFSIVGDTVAHLLSPDGTAITGSIPLGIAAHYLIGPLMGGIFGAAAKCIDIPNGSIFRVDSPKKVIVLAVLYAEILSQPLLALAPILLPMTVSQTLQWYGGSLVMHLVWGYVLGMIWRLGLWLPVVANPK